MTDKVKEDMINILVIFMEMRWEKEKWERKKMDYNSTYEQEIDLKDLMFMVLHKWRPIIFIAIVMALILGGAKGAMTYKSQNDPETIKEAEEKYQDDLELYEKNKKTCERELENLKTDIANQQEYLEKSIWINMSPYDVCESRMDLYVTSDYEIMPGMVYQNLDYTDTILQAYQAMLTSSAVMEDIARNVGTEPRYLNELVSVNVGTNSDKLNRLLTISVKHMTKSEAQKVMEEILDHMDDMQAQITASIGEHTVNTVNHGVSAMVDLTLADKQRLETERLTTLNDSLEAKQKSLEDMEEPKETVSSQKAALKSGVKYAVLGGVLGGFVVVFFVCVSFLMSDKVYSARELKNRYRVKILGTLPIANKKILKGVDAWLNRLEGRAGGVNEDVEYALIAANIRNYADNMKSLLVTGSTDPATVKHVAEKLAAELSGINVTAGGNMLQEVETLKKLPECDCVVLVEKCLDSKYSTVEQEIEKATDLQKKIVGCVVFE